MHLISSLVLAVLIISSTPPGAPPPNIVYILVDDLGYGDLSCYGQTNWTTPRIDRMAEQGMLFTQAYAGCTVCAPSRASLLTGQHTGHVWQRANGRIQFRPDPDDITIATRLKASGYATAMIGKSGLACQSDGAQLPNDKGFDYFFGILDHADAHRQYPVRLHRNGQEVPVPDNHGKTGEQYANTLFVEDALVWIGDHKHTPFFLHLSLTLPHADLAGPDRYMAPFRGRFKETPHQGDWYYKQPEPKAAYAGMIAFIDESVGRVLDQLNDLGIAERTVVIFASDNGPHFAGGAHPDHFDSNGPLRGGKRDLYEGGIRTPQIIWWPGTIPAGSRSDVITAMWDFAPTALALARAPVPEHMDGLSILPLLKGQHDLQEKHAYLYWEFHEQGGKQAVRMGPWKGVRLDVSRQRHGPIELYNLDTDPSETTDVADQHPGIIERIKDIMDRAHVPTERFSFDE